MFCYNNIHLQYCDIILDQIHSTSYADDAITREHIMVISNGDKRRERFGNSLNRCRRRRDLSTDVIIVSVCIPNNIILLLSSPSYTGAHYLVLPISDCPSSHILTYVHTYIYIFIVHKYIYIYTDTCIVHT